MSENIGYRIEIDRPKVPDLVLEAYRELESVYVTDAMSGFGGMTGIQAVAAGMCTVGRALTVRPAANDNLAAYLATKYIQPNDVLVIECRGQTAVAQWGDTASEVAKQAGAAGVVMDGATRDREGMVRVGLPVFASPNFVPQRSSRVGPGEINVPVAVGGVSVLPGDLIVADDHGVVAVPSTHVDATLIAAQKVAVQDEEKMRSAATKDPLVTSWLGAAMDHAGYPKFHS